MKRLIGVLLTLVLALAACATPEELPQDDIGALEETESEEQPAEGSRGGGGKGDSPKKKAAPKKGGGGEPAQPAGGGGGNGGGGSAQPGGNGSSGGGGAPAAGAAIAPVPADTYDYATQGERSVSGNEEPLPETTTLSAAAPASGLQRQTRDLRDSEGNGILTETDLLYRGGDVYLKYVKITARFQGGLTDVREFRLPRPQMIAPAGAGPGFKRGFTMEGSGTRAKVALQALRYEDVTISGKTVRALVVQNDIVFSGALEGYQNATTWFLPKHLLPLREQVETDVRNGPVRLQSNYVATIRRIP
ncbi:MAG TPA: hypothetical protein VG318_01765 [Actinomycetota bacterium]|nr:hypothetical protein [Actinomycetota bacterium]